MNSTKQRIIEAMAALMQRRGYSGSGLKQVSSDGGAPFGSVYHFFPGGKEQLAAETLRWSGRGYAELVGAVLDESGDDIVAVVRHSFNLAGEHLVESDYIDACPIATVALEVASSNDTLRQVTAEIFESWLVNLEQRFESAGIDQPAARELAVLYLAALEGGFLLSRATRDPEPLRTLGKSVADQVAATRESGRRPTPDRRRQPSSSRAG